jgi:hypothetical protein
MRVRIAPTAAKRNFPHTKKMAGSFLPAERSSLTQGLLASKHLPLESLHPSGKFRHYSRFSSSSSSSVVEITLELA